MNSIGIRTIDAVKDADALVDILSTGAVFPLLVTGSSMIPFLREGRDTVFLRKPDRLHRGQIVFFRRKSGEFTLHRIRKIYKDGRLLINGDAQSWCEIIDPDQVLAEVVSVKRDGKERRRTPLLRILWYPTRPFRPLIWRAYGAFRRIFK